MSKFITWLISLFIHPKEENNQMSEPLSDASVVQPVSAAPATAEVITPATEVKSGVQDFEAAMNFVVDGVEKLGDAAKDELIALAKKYL
ncbi:hypothetical protein L585_08650 [Pantoea ananatis BRT175]|uniref:hypothetical protein n=1 Tax=Pantoea ananas TaxID=553 RepID=UPI0003B19B28|nr:hypothetical protein [Pantoea ananatis]ERM14382.1 hypothetical protein L585_08650 [Pantoea ananatis BRT175]